MAKRKMTARVYIDWINYLGEVNDSVMIAQFINRSWADAFVEKICNPQEEIPNVVYRVEVDE